MYRYVILIVLTLLLPFIAMAQPAQVEEEEMKIADAMNQMLDRHPFRFWILRVQPRVFMNTGYDSNGLNSSTQEIDDYFLSLSPGGSFALRFGNHAFLEVEENVNFLYYNELEQRRDIFNTTVARFTTGSRRTLFTVRGSYLQRKERIDSEFDVPADQTITSGGSHFEVAVVPKLNLHFDLNVAKFLYEQDPEISNPFPPPPDNRRLGYGGWFDYKVHPRLSLTFGTDIDRIEFLDNDDNRNSYNLLGGIRVYAPGIYGHFRIGYGETEVQRESTERSSGLRMNGGLDFRVRERIKLGIFLRRGEDVSRLASGNIRITTEGQFRAAIPVGMKAFVDGAYLVGQNDYGRNNPSGRKDHYNSIQSGFNYYLAPNFRVRSGVIYYTRNSSLEVYDKKRFAYDLGFHYQFTP